MRLKSTSCFRVAANEGSMDVVTDFESARSNPRTDIGQQITRGYPGSPDVGNRVVENTRGETAPAGVRSRHHGAADVRKQHRQTICDQDCAHGTRHMRD
jgi:hypothetical protein